MAVKIKLNKTAIRTQLLKSKEMKQRCREEAYEIRHRLGKGYRVNTHTGKNRVNAMIYANTPEAQKENMEMNTMLKAVRPHD